MKAAVYKGKQRLEVEDIPTPEPGPGELLVKIKYSAICGTDVHAWLYDAVPPGNVMGHEFCGTVAEVGAGVSRWKVGDRVVGGGGTPPPTKRPAFRTEPRFNWRTMGYAPGRVQGYGEYTVMQEYQPLPIPEGVSDEAAALLEPCSVAVRAVRISRLRLGDSAVVIGAGPIGLLCIQAARAAGAGAVFVSEPVPARAEIARQTGADAVIDPTGEDLEAQVVSMTAGLGADVVFECAGVGTTLDQAFNIVRRDGQVMLVSLAYEQIPLLPVDWIAREINMQMSFAADPEDWRIAMELIRRGKFRMEPLISETGFIPLDDIQQTFEALLRPTTELQMVIKL